VSGRAVDKNTPADLSKGVIWTFDDLSEKKTLEQNLIYEKNKFENMFRHHSAIMFIVDPENGRMVDANNAAVEFYQYSYHELISLKIYDINSLSREEIDEKMHKVKQEELKSFIFKHKKKDGSVVYVEGFGSTILVDGKKLLFSIVHDISQRVKDEEDKNRYHRELELLNRNLNERVEAEAQKRVAQELIFKQIFNSLDSFVSLVDRDYRYVIVNEKYSEVFGINEKELVGKHISVVIGEDSFNGKTKALLDRAFSGEVITVDGYSSVDREEGMYVETTFCPYIEDGKEISSVIVSSRDVTERYELKKEIQKKENLMIQQSKLADMGSMIATIAHQWKQPLNILALSAEIYKAEHEDDEDAEVLAAEISAQVKYMADTVNDFRNFFNPTKRKHNFVIMSAVEQIMRMLESKMKTQDIKIEFFGDDGIQAYGFRNEFMQVMVNLIVNARDAITGSSSEGGEISIEILHEDSWAVIKVKDTGGGISEELLPEKLFESYFTTKGEGGTGIGLSMAKTIIEQYMEGSISASNIEGGAEFIIKLPAEEVKINENIEIINKCILYVEDDEFTLKNVSSLLEKRYKCVIRAENGAEGLELYKKYIDKIGLIVTDIDMPKMNGLEMTKRIRELNSEIPVYAVTSIKEDVYEDIGFSGIIEKPIHLKALYKLLAEAEKGRID